MKGFHYKVIKVFLLLFIAQSAWGQTDLSLSIATPGNPLNLPADGTMQTLTYTVVNDMTGQDDTAVGMEFQFSTEISPANVTSPDPNWDCSVSTQEVSCNYMGTFGTGLSSVLNFNFNSPINEIMLNNAVDVTVFSSLVDTNPANNQVITNINFVNGGVDLSIVKSITPGFQSIVAPGDPISFDLLVTNLSTTDATGILITDDLIINNLQFDQASSSPECDEISVFVECNLSFLAAGDTVVLTIAANVDTSAQPGGKINEANLSAFETDPDTTNNIGSQPFEVAIGGAQADLSVLNTSAAGIYTENDTITYGFEVSSSMGSSVSPTDVVLTIDLPIEVSFTGVDVSSAPDWSCAHDTATSGGVVTCDRGGVAFTPFTTNNISVEVLAQTPSTNAVMQASINSASIPDLNMMDNTFNQSDVINAGVSDFSINKTVSGLNFDVGDSFNYVLEINNPTPSTASPIDVVINDQLPVEVSYDSFSVTNISGTTVNCSHDGAATGGLFSCNTNGTPFPPGETVTIDINVIAAVADANVDNSATVETSVDPNGTTNNNNDNAMTVVISGPPVTTIAANKIASIAGAPVSVVNYGQTFMYVLEVQNTGLNDAENVTITDSLPTDVSWVSTQASGWTCTNNVTKFSKGGADVNCILDTPLPPGSSAQIEVEVVATTNNTINLISNTMEVNGDNTGPEITSTVVVSLQSSQASLILSQSPSPVDPGEDVDFNLMIENTGTSNLTGVEVNSQLPAGFTFNAFSGANWSCNENAGQVTCMYTGVLAANTGSQLNLETTAIAAAITSTKLNEKMNPPSILDVTLSANELSADIFESLNVVFSTSDVDITMTSLPQQISQGTTFKHLIRVSNSGNFDLLNVSTLYAIPSAAIVKSVAAADFNCSNSSNTISCDNLHPLAVGEVVQIEISLQVDDSIGLIVASVSVNADGITESASTSTQIMGDLQNDLALTKTASVSEVGQGNIFTYQLDVTNVGSETQTTFGLIDSLPAGVVFESASGNNWSCDGNNLLNCQYNGSLIAGSQTQLLVEVVAPNQTGVITNTANISFTADENASNDTSSVAVNVVQGQGGGAARADLAVVIEANTSNVISTEQVSWRIEVSNAGPDVAQNIVVRNTIPMGFSAESVEVNSGAECTLLEALLQCEIATLGVNQSNEIVLEGRFSDGFSGLVFNTVEVESDTIDNNPGNNNSTGEVTVTDAQDLTADLALELNSGNQQVQQGGVVDLTFIAKNLGPDRAVNAEIAGSLSGLIETVQLMNTGEWMCQSNNNSISCMFPGDLQVGMQSEINLRVQTQQVVQQSQPIMFNATIDSDAMDSQPSNNMIGFTNEVTRTPTEDEIFAAFRNAVGSGASDTVIQSIRNVSSYCARSYFMAIEGLCEEFIAGATPENGAAIINAMEELTPNEVAAQSNSAAEIITSQFRNVDSRLAQLRGGGGAGFSVAGLNGRYGDESIPLGMLAYLNQSEDEQAVNNINDFVSPWGFFVNGSISMGERDATSQELGFDFDTFGVTAGVDYRFSPTKVAGVALGYANFDSEVEGEAELKSTGVTLTGYGSFYIKDNFYVDARISYGNPDFEQKRRINFEVDEIIIDRVAIGKTDSDQYSMAMSAGYHFNKNSWAITPNASVRYVRTTIDAFQESGAGGFNFAFGEQEVESMVWSIGTSVSKAISLKNGVISPQFDININRETENDGGLLEARFINAPDDEIFFIGTDEPDRTYGSAGIGLVFIGANGKQAYINYRSIFGLEGFTRGTINVGARFEF